MSERHGVQPIGTPTWIDVTVPDRAAAMSFYAGLFGWTFDEAGEDFGHYTTALLAGRKVAGLGTPPPGTSAPPTWTTYLAVEDVDATLGAVTEHGGQVLAPTMPVGDMGTLAVIADPTGGVVGLWQAGSHAGVEVIEEPGAMAWTELMTPDHDAAVDFYVHVFGFEPTPMSGEGFTYTTLALGGITVAGIGGFDERTPPETPPAWRIYFQVPDLDAAVDTVLRAGGAELTAAADSPYGRLATVAGPAGETFVLLARPAGWDAPAALP